MMQTRDYDNSHANDYANANSRANDYANVNSHANDYANVNSNANVPRLPRVG